MTFASLSADLQAYLERGYPSDTTVYDQIPRLINLAERAIARQLKVEGFITPVISQLVKGVSVYSKPDRWRETISMNYGTGSSNNSRTPIYPRGYEYNRRYWPDATQLSPPKFYSDYDYSHWLIVPTPDATYPWEALYWQQPPLLDNNNQTNWITNFAPNMLLYRALLEMTPFLKNDERIPVWQQFYEAEVANVKQEDLEKIIDRSAERNNK